MSPAANIISHDVYSPLILNSTTGKLSSRCSAADLLEELSVVLDEAAEPFVLKLWRMLVYYTVKNQQ